MGYGPVVTAFSTYSRVIDLCLSTVASPPTSCNGSIGCVSTKQAINIKSVTIHDNKIDY